MWIVGTTNSVEVMLLHKTQIPFDQFYTFRVTRFWIMLMFVYTADHQWFAIQAELAVSDLDFPKPYLIAFDLDRGAVFVKQ